MTAFNENCLDDQKANLSDTLQGSDGRTSQPVAQSVLVMTDMTDVFGNNSEPFTLKNIGNIIPGPGDDELDDDDDDDDFLDDEDEGTLIPIEGDEEDDDNLLNADEEDDIIPGSDMDDGDDLLDEDDDYDDSII